MVGEPLPPPRMKGYWVPNLPDQEDGSYDPSRLI